MSPRILVGAAIAAALGLTACGSAAPVAVVSTTTAAPAPTTAETVAPQVAATKAILANDPAVMEGLQILGADLGAHDCPAVINDSRALDAVLLLRYSGPLVDLISSGLEMAVVAGTDCVAGNYDLAAAEFNIAAGRFKAAA